MTAYRAYKDPSKLADALSHGWSVVAGVSIFDCVIVTQNHFYSGDVYDSGNYKSIDDLYEAMCVNFKPNKQHDNRDSAGNVIALYGEDA